MKTNSQKISLDFEEAKPRNTREKILDKSRRLFNVDGLQATAIYRVAADLKISPGNLSYHFKSKSDIVAALASDFEAAFDTMASNTSLPATTMDFIFSMKKILVLIWSYRFLFTTSKYASLLDEDLANRFAALRQSLRDLVRRNARNMIDAKGMQAPSDARGEILADNIVAAWMYWLQNQDSEGDIESDEPTASALKDCLEHHFGLLEPYLSHSFARHFKRNLEIAYRVRFQSPPRKGR